MQGEPAAPARLRRAHRARAVPAQGCLRRQARHPRCSSVVRRPLAPAVSKTRGCAEQFAHHVCTCTQSRTHAARFRVCARAWASCFPGQAGSLAPVPCGQEQKPAPNFHEYVKRGVKRSPTHRNARKAELCSLAFRAFPLSAGGLRPKGPLSRPAARERGRSATGHRRPPSHRNA